jgi:hypothetical protein
MAALIAPPAYVVATSREDILKLVLTGVVCITAALIGGHTITVRSRIPVMPNIRVTVQGTRGRPNSCASATIFGVTDGGDHVVARHLRGLGEGTS